MTELLFINGGVTSPKGFVANGVHCGIRKNKQKKDLSLIYCETPCAAAAVYTQNKVKGSPIIVTKHHIQDGFAKAVIVNSGNANTCNADGEEKATMMCNLVANKLQIKPEDVIVASTGVIGQPLPIEPIQEGIDPLCEGLSKQGGSDAAEAIMTTDTVKKEYAVTFKIGDAVCTIGGMAKGSGMIHPNMATMLGFITTDAKINPCTLQKALTKAVDVTFNMVSVDGDTSTNDMVSILASGFAENQEIQENTEEFDLFVLALTELCIKLSKNIAKDGEGATKLLECKVSGAKSNEDAKIIAKEIIASSLVKAAMFGADANWGRILCAIGYAKADVDITKVSVSFKSIKGLILVCENGAGVDFNEETAKGILLEDEIQILVSLEDGESSATAWGCDLTYDYVKINGDYRT